MTMVELTKQQQYYPNVHGCKFIQTCQTTWNHASTIGI